MIMIRLLREVEELKSNSSEIDCTNILR